MLRTRSPRKEKISNCYLHSNSLSNKMDNSLLAVRDINHKYIVVGRRKQNNVCNFKREIRSYFQTVVDGFLLAVLALYGLYFYAYNLRSGSPYVSYSLSAVSFIVMIAVPVLTMRSFAEERHTKTDQLMLTSPVPLGKIVFGKYLAMVGVFSIAMIVVALTPLFLSIYGSVPLGESYVAFLGFWLYGCACIAIGMLMSVVTESQGVAKEVLDLCKTVSGYMMSSITSMISQSGNLLTKILNAYDLYTRWINL